MPHLSSLFRRGHIQRKEVYNQYQLYALTFLLYASINKAVLGKKGIRKCTSPSHSKIMT